MAAVTVDLDPDTEEQLRLEAKRRGQEPEAYARQLIEDGLPSHVDPDWQKRLDCIVADFRRGVEESGAAGEDVSATAIEAAITSARAERRAAKQTQRPQPNAGRR